MPSHSSNSLRKLIVFGLFVAMAIVLSYFERYIPMNFTMPGIKLGLANVVTLMAITFYRPKEVYGLVIVRVILASVLVGSMMGLWYSLAGGIFSATTMLVMNLLPKDKVSLVGISVVGAISHNIGQIVIVVIITGSISVAVTYFPVLLVSGVVTGIFIGYVANATRPYLQKILRFN